MSDNLIDMTSSTRLADVRFQHLDDVPAAATWFANIANPQTRRAYQSDLTEFMTFTGIADPDQFRSVRRGHLLAWRKDLEQRALSSATIRRTAQCPLLPV
jgi:integrase/recombinase XerD